MKIRLLIITADTDYADHLSNILAEKYADTFEINVCFSAERLRELCSAGKFETALFDPEFLPFINKNSIQLPLILTDEPGSDGLENNFKKILKYQRISSIAGNILENYAEAGKIVNEFGSHKARVTVSWSPAGGSGKTTVALAYAANKVFTGKQVLYLNMENFSSASVYFQENGKSISKVFEKLESNVNIFLTGIRQRDGGSGISYFCGPENYDDINILTADDIAVLTEACISVTDELVIDLPSQCDERIQKVFEIADTVLLVCDPSAASQAKLKQFINQHNIFGKIQSKTVIVNNKGANTINTGITKTLQLPFVQSADPISVFKTLSGGNFEW